jgi:hypothetical protein
MEKKQEIVAVAMASWLPSELLVPGDLAKSFVMIDW